MKLGILLSAWEVQDPVLSASGIHGWPAGLFLSMMQDLARRPSVARFSNPNLAILEFIQDKPLASMLRLDLPELFPEEV
jgi:hypothetical protein